MRKTAGIVLGALLMLAVLLPLSTANAAPTVYTHYYAGSITGTTGADHVKNITIPYKTDKTYNFTLVIDFQNYTSASDFAMELESLAGVQYAIGAYYENATHLNVIANSQIFPTADGVITIQGSYNTDTNVIDTASPYQNGSTDGAATAMTHHILLENEAQVEDNTITYKLYLYTATSTLSERMGGLLSQVVPLIGIALIVTLVSSFLSKRGWR